MRQSFVRCLANVCVVAFSFSPSVYGQSIILETAVAARGNAVLGRLDGTDRAVIHSELLTQPIKASAERPVELGRARLGEFTLKLNHAEGSLNGVLSISDQSDAMRVAIGFVRQGWVTFAAEGNNDLNSRYFSRVVHWPGNAQSGVTLGRGYDMGRRQTAEIEEDLMAAGLAPQQAQAYAKGAGLKGAAAEDFVRSQRKALGPIPRLVEIRLFNRIYPGYVQLAIDNYDRWTANKPTRTPWADLHPAIRDILVDFVYQGFTKGPRPMEKGMHNDLDELIDYITTNPTMRRYEAGRNRAGFLRAHLPPNHEQINLATARATLSRGDRGNRVQQLQLMLNRVLQPPPNLDTDGIFGRLTEEAVRAFQRGHKLKPTGTVDDATWDAFDRIHKRHSDTSK